MMLILEVLTIYNFFEIAMIRLTNDKNDIVINTFRINSWEICVIVIRSTSNENNMEISGPDKDKTNSSNKRLRGNRLKFKL